MNEFNQLCVWPGTVLGNSTVEDFEEFFANEMGTRIKYAEEVTTLPDRKNGKIVPGTGGRTDQFFYVHGEDVPRFAVPRLGMGIRWWEDVLLNGHGDIYPPEVLQKYIPLWGFEDDPEGDEKKAPTVKLVEVMEMPLRSSEHAEMRGRGTTDHWMDGRMFRQR